MTATELRAIGVAYYGDLWQSKLARAIEISPRHMRRLAAGTATLSDDLAHRVLVVTKSSMIESLAWPRDEWVIGDGGAPHHREYLLHAQPPRFLARVFSYDESLPADETTGTVYASDDHALCEIVWIDPMPVEPALYELLKRASKFVDEQS